jgi:hypothetical protein
MCLDRSRIPESLCSIARSTFMAPWTFLDAKSWNHSRSGHPFTQGLEWPLKSSSSLSSRADRDHMGIELQRWLQPDWTCGSLTRLSRCFCYEEPTMTCLENVLLARPATSSWIVFLNSWLPSEAYQDRQVTWPSSRSFTARWLTT